MSEGIPQNREPTSFLQDIAIVVDREAGLFEERPQTGAGHGPAGSDASGPEGTKPRGGGAAGGGRGSSGGGGRVGRLVSRLAFVEDRDSTVDIPGDGTRYARYEPLNWFPVS